MGQWVQNKSSIRVFSIIHNIIFGSFQCGQMPIIDLECNIHIFQIQNGKGWPHGLIKAMSTVNDSNLRICRGVAQVKNAETSNKKTWFHHPPRKGDATGCNCVTNQNNSVEKKRESTESTSNSTMISINLNQPFVVVPCNTEHLGWCNFGVTTLKNEAHWWATVEMPGISDQELPMKILLTSKHSAWCHVNGDESPPR